MVQAPTPIDADKPTIFRDLFIATADENYITPRLAAFTSLPERIKTLMLIHADQALMAPPNVSPHT